MSFSEHMCIFLLGVYPWVELLGSGVQIINFSRSLVDTVAFYYRALAFKFFCAKICLHIMKPDLNH